MLKELFSYMKQYKKYAWISLVCIAVECILLVSQRADTWEMMAFYRKNSIYHYFIANY